MTLIEAIRTGLPLTRLNKSWTYINLMTYGAIMRGTILPNTFIDPQFFLSQIRLDTDDILADDWIVKNDLKYETVE